MPNAVSGKTIDFKSFRVTSHIVCSLSKTHGGDCSRDLSCQFILLLHLHLPSSPVYHDQLGGALRTSGSCFTKGSKGDSSLQVSALAICPNNFEFSIATTIQPAKRIGNWKVMPWPGGVAYMKSSHST